jgi:glycosyltransferase involved in cell wall biosynthesis
MERVKVLHFITHLGVGGALDNTLLTVKGLPRDRYEVHLAAGELAPGDNYTDWKARAKECADALFVFPELRRPIDPPRDFLALQRITAFIREQNYQIVHTHCAKAGIVGRIAAQRAGIPVVVHTFHSFSWQVAHGFHASALQNHLSSARKRSYIAIERYVASLTDALITVSESGKQEVLDRKLAPPEKLTKIYSGVDLNRFTARSASRTKLCRMLGLDPSRPVVGTIGRLSIQKAPLDFVQAAKIILRQKPEVQFVLVGDGPLAAAVREAIGSESRIMMLGFRDDVPEMLALLDIFVLSSLWEGLGRALTEAMVMGLPVAATAVNGVLELVTHKKTGMLSPPREPVRLAENIMWLLDHPEEMREMCARARERVMQSFGAERMVQQIEELYERLLAGKGIPSPRFADYLLVTNEWATTKE